jgi:hypothetical protein
MLAVKRNLIALALGAALASPLAYAQAANAAGKALPTQANAQATANASDAMSAKTTARETAATYPKTTTSNTATSMREEAKYPPGKGNWWKDADTDGDGKLSSTEANANAGLSASFTTIDSNKDGFVTMDEYRTYYASTASQGETHAAAHSAVVTRDVWMKLDTDSDGKISAAEAAANTDINSAFATMDANNDGFITQAEYSAYHKMK